MKTLEIGEKNKRVNLQNDLPKAIKCSKWHQMVY